uniref:Uncharacterized protein n=1 Tax=Rhizophagus irregularis (strain DAOM 181602 / DAOM 197198 / MUCL 43194) TaxID=747089 RepID=U9SRW5_RHIID
MTYIFMKHPILKLVALIPIGHRSIPNDRTITQLLDGDIDLRPISLSCLLMKHTNIIMDALIVLYNL